MQCGAVGPIESNKDLSNVNYVDPTEEGDSFAIHKSNPQCTHIKINTSKASNCISSPNLSSTTKPFSN